MAHGPAGKSEKFPQIKSCALAHALAFVLVLGLDKDVEHLVGELATVRTWIEPE